MTNASKTGPLSISDITAIWTAAVDSSYSQAFIAAGEGNGFEAYTQGFAQYARASLAIDITTQACYALPWSGQTNPPASGAQFATVMLTFTRAGFLNQPIRLASGGIVYYDEQTNDWSIINGSSTPNPVLTGRRYTLQQDLVIMPGEMGPITVSAIAENPGYGYNNPQPGTIQVFDQPGEGYYNIDASVSLTVSSNTYTLTAADIADMFVPNHVGQYVLFTGGANAGTIARIVSFVNPNSTTSTGSGVVLEPMAVVETTSTITPSLIPGEPLIIKSGATQVGLGTFVQITPFNTPVQAIAFVLLSGTFATGDTLTGQVSGGVATISNVLNIPSFNVETGTASWRILSWANDFQLTVTNAAQPTGGAYPMLDGIGADKNLPRLPNEPDNLYRLRISTIADVVTPNAIKRALNRNLGAIPWCFREVGTEPGQVVSPAGSLPGFFYGDNQQGLASGSLPDGHGDFYDYDAVLVTGTPTGTFLNGERVVQVQSGVAVRGRALTQSAVPSTPFVPGKAGTTGIPGAYSFVGVAGIQGGSLGTFTIVTGVQILGKLSGATVTPSAVSGGIAVVPTNRFRVYLDYLRFRAYFLVTLPQLDFGDFGFFWGAGNGSFGLGNWWSMPPPGLDFYNGYPTGIEAIYKQVYSNVDTIRAAGVFWEMQISDTSCQ
jgi:hypothetical protein